MIKTPFVLTLSLIAAAVAPQVDTPRVGPASQDGHIVATGQRIRPAGDSVEFSGRPVDLALAPHGRTLYVKDNRGLVAIDTQTWKVRQELPFTEGSGGGSPDGIAITRDGSRVYATTAQNHLAEAKVTSEGRLAWGRTILLPGPPPDGKGYAHPCGIALSPDEKRAYVCLSRNNSLGVIDLESGMLRREIRVGVAPFDVALSADGRTAFVSNWGGAHPEPGERRANSSGTDVAVDRRGIAVQGSISFVDVEEGRETSQTPTGLHPSDVVLSADGSTLFVANANSDTVSVLDVATRRTRETLLVRPDPRLPYGSAPNALALSRDGATLYVANGGNNAVAVVSMKSGKQGRSEIRGFIPAGWYPGSVVTDGKNLYIANVKGLGSRRREEGDKGWHVKRFLGTINRVPIPGAGMLASYTRQVHADGRIPEILKAWERAQSGQAAVPVPERPGECSVFEHMVYIIKENRTYDQVFGDLPQGDGDPRLCIFGREVTPNHHALAEQFVLLDNFYCNGVNSADGHAWSTEGNVTGYLEKAFGGFTRTYTFGDDPLSYSSSGFIWDSVLLAGLSFRNFGEMDYATPVPANATFKAIYDDFRGKTGKIRFTQNIGIARLRGYSSPSYPGWNMRIPDVLRAEAFLRELKQAETPGTWPNLTIVYLPQDHTSGTAPGEPTPRAHMADNDLALGRIIEGISRSRFWPKTCVFVIEDDPQDGFDHIDGHRSLCLVVSPYTKRGAVVSDFYNQTSLLHTIARILGIPPLNQMDALSPVMTACFQKTPDLRPYRALPNRIPLDELNPKLSALSGRKHYWAQKSRELPLEKFDQADEDTLNRILWHSIKGVNAPYPAHLAGAHGTGLKARRLRREDRSQKPGP